MESGRGHGAVPHREVSRPHRGARPQGPGAARGPRDQPGRARDRRCARRGAQGRKGARPAARHPDPDQGQHRHRRPDDDHGRLAGAGGLDSGRDAFVAARLRDGGAVLLGKTNLSEWANFRSTHSSQRLERPRRPVPQPLRARPQPLRARAPARRAAVAASLLRGRGRHRDRRLDRLPVDNVRPGRDQADARPGQPRRHHPDRPQPGHRRPDGAHGRRCGGPARGDRRRRSRATP